MSKDESKQYELKKINKKIEELREILNEICCTVAEDEENEQRLAVSVALDELIVKYMKELNK